MGHRYGLLHYLFLPQYFQMVVVRRSAAARLLREKGQRVQHLRMPQIFLLEVPLRYAVPTLLTCKIKYYNY
jgi:hypothetical protein